MPDFLSRLLPSSVCHEPSSKLRDFHLQANSSPSSAQGRSKKTLDAAKKGTRNFKQINRTLGFCFRAAEFVPHFGSCNFGVTSGSGSGPRGSTNQKPEDGSRVSPVECINAIGTKRRWTLREAIPLREHLRPIRIARHPCSTAIEWPTCGRRSRHIQPCRLFLPRIHP